MSEVCIRQVRSGQYGKKFENNKLNLMGVQGVRWDRGGTEPAGEYTFFYERFITCTLLQI
jgi:hypothetical protein